MAVAASSLAARGRTMTDRTTGERLGRLLPILMSMLCIGVLIEGLLELRVLPQSDVGRPGHVFQLLMMLQLPIIVMYGVISRRQFRQSLPVILLQTGMWFAAVVMAMILVG
jgi:hypothetical protein